MRPRLPLAIITTVAALTATTGHASSIQEDITACGAAAVEAGLIGPDARLRFVKDRGNRNRVLKLTASRSDAEPVDLDCLMNRRTVREVVLTEE